MFDPLNMRSITLKLYLFYSSIDQAHAWNWDGQDFRSHHCCSCPCWLQLQKYEHGIPTNCSSHCIFFYCIGVDISLGSGMPAMKQCATFRLCSTFIGTSKLSWFLVRKLKAISGLKLHFLRLLHLLVIDFQKFTKAQWCQGSHGHRGSTLVFDSACSRHVHELGIVHLEEEITLLGSQECENLSTAGGHSNTFTTCNRRRPPCPVLQLRSRYVP